MTWRPWNSYFIILLCNLDFQFAWRWDCIFLFCKYTIFSKIILFEVFMCKCNNKVIVYCKNEIFCHTYLHALCSHSIRMTFIHIPIGFLLPILLWLPFPRVRYDRPVVGDAKSYCYNFIHSRPGLNHLNTCNPHRYYAVFTTDI